MRKNRPEDVEKTFMDNVRNTIKEDEESKKSESAKIAIITAGSMSNMPIDSPYFRQWLQQHQNKNPLIGKHVQSAPEYNTPTRNFGETTSDIDALDVRSIAEIATGTTTKYNSNESDVFNIKSIELSINSGKADTEQYEEKFLDVVIIENVTRSLPLTTSIDEIKIAAQQTMRDHYGDDTYVSDIKYEDIIENSRIMMLTNGVENKTKFLGIISSQNN